MECFLRDVVDSLSDPLGQVLFEVLERVESGDFYPVDRMAQREYDFSVSKLSEIDEILHPRYTGRRLLGSRSLSLLK